MELGVSKIYAQKTMWERIQNIFEQKKGVANPAGGLE